MTEPLNIWIAETGTTLYKVLTADTQLFRLAERPGEADYIIFENDKPEYIRPKDEFKNWPDKCVVISETDLPTYFLPACYASNKKGWLSHGRTQTISYFLSQRTIPNPFIKEGGYGSEPLYLYSFRGGSTSWVRKKLFKHKPQFKDVCIEESNHYYHWSYDDSYMDKKAALQKQYALLLQQSLFFLCPRGAGVGSIRLFEVMQAGRIPVIIADDWVPIENIPWEAFSLRIPERKITRVDGIIRSNANRSKELGENAIKAWKDFFSPEKDLALVAAALKRIHANRNEGRERFIRMIFPLFGQKTRMWEKFRKLSKFLILKAYSLTGKEFPYSLNRPISEQLKKKK